MPTKYNLSTIAKNLLRVILGYVSAALSAGLAFTFLAFLKSSDKSDLMELWYSVLLGAMSGIIIAITVAPAAIIAIIVAEYFVIRRWLYYTAFGAGAAYITALVFFPSPASINDFIISLFFAVLGLISGWVYWRIAGRRAGGWNSQNSNHPEE